MTFKEFFTFKKNAFFWVNMILMFVLVILLIYGILWGLDKYTRHGHSIVVPDVKGMSLAEAQATFKNNGLSSEIIDSNYVKSLTPGVILEQKPAKDMRVKSGRIIYLTINTQNVPLQTVPDVADNSSLREAQAKLQAVGFKLTEEEYVSGERDWVYGVKYRGRLLKTGEQVPQGATLTLQVGRGHDMEIETLRPENEEAVFTTPQETQKDGVIEESWF